MLLHETPAILPQADITDATSTPVDFWDKHVLVAENNFQHKSLSDWACNTSVGCLHGCRFCYVPEVSTRKLSAPLAQRGVDNPDAEWGGYAFVRPFDEEKFRASVKKAERTPVEKLSRDGNRAVMFSTTTDPYQVFFHPDAEKRAQLNQASTAMMTRALEIIRDESTLNVRILTRSPLVRQDFPVLKSLGNRVVLGMSLPTLRADLANVYEPGAPAPARRLDALHRAKDEGIPVCVMMAPTFAECDRDDLRITLNEIKSLEPITIFHEPINIRADNAQRIAEHAKSIGVPVRTDVFATKEAWEGYALQSFADMEAVAKEVGVYDQLHLWIDGALGTRVFLRKTPNPVPHQVWVNYWWNRISEWPGKPAEFLNSLEAPPNPHIVT
jgi:DNA repair photolyase